MRPTHDAGGHDFPLSSYNAELSSFFIGLGRSGLETYAIYTTLRHSGIRLCLRGRLGVT
jgi:hypothetical protein